MSIRTAAALLLSSVPLSAAALASDASVPVAAVPDAAAVAGRDASGDLLVTALRTPRLLSELAAAATLFDKADIDRAQAVTVDALLQRAPGVSVARNGGYGTVTTLRLRGAEAGQTVVVIDGVKMNDPSSTDGAYNFANLLIGDATRIELLRGPQSILWGSQAIGGVLNIVTPLPETALEGGADVEGGAMRTVNARAALGGRHGPLAWRVAGQGFSTAGISSIAPAFGGQEKDGYTSQNIEGRMEIGLTPHVSADFRGHYANGRADFDDFAGDAPLYAKTREFLGYAGLNVSLFEGRLRNRLAYNHTDSRSRNYDPRRQRQLSFDSAGRNDRFEYEGSLAVSEQVAALFGAEHERARFHSVSPDGSLAVPIPAAARGAADLTGLYAELDLKLPAGLTLSGGLRHDHHSDYGGHSLFAAGAVWEMVPGTTLRASYGEGFKAPTLYQLFSEYGNTTLAPERAHSIEAGIEQRLLDGRLRLGASYFDRRTSDQIDFSSCLPGNDDPLCLQPGTTTQRFGYYANIARTRARGLELVSSLSIDGLLLDGNYSWTAAENRSGGSGDFGNWLARRPRHAANGSVSYAFPFGLDAGAAVRWSGRAFDDVANSVELPSYTLVDLRAEQRLASGFTVFGRLENLFDRAHMTAYRYGSTGRAFYLGVRNRF